LAVPVILYVKRTDPAGPGRGTIILDPGNWTSPGSWVATEVPHEGDPIFIAKSGTYSIQNRIVALIDTNNKKAVEVRDYGDGPLGVGPGTTFDPDPDDRPPMHIAWKLSVWPPD
jgi:hypothetical protein